MRVLVCGARGCVGQATVRALRSRGHLVIEGARGLPKGGSSLPIDFMTPVSAADWARDLKALRVEAVVNCVGILMASARQTFERVHSEGPIELFRGAALAGVACVVQVSALGVSDDADSLSRPYLASKLEADDALAALGMDWAVVRPALIYGPGSQSAALFATLASLPVIGLPGEGRQSVQPVHVFEVAECIARLLENRAPRNQVHELGGAAAMSYRDMLQAYRQALGLGEALWIPVPMPVMRLSAWLAERLPQQVLCRDTIALLDRGSVPSPNQTALLLGRGPASLARGLRITAPQPMLNLHVTLPPGLDGALRFLLATMWFYTALVSTLWPAESGITHLLEQTGLQGTGLVLGAVASCTLNSILGWLVWRHPTPWCFALQFGAVVGYTVGAAFAMPQILIDHCGPLVKNLPLLGLVTLLWLARPAAGPLKARAGGQRGACEDARVGGRSTLHR